jgi:hypothetical protein
VQIGQGVSAEFVSHHYNGEINNRTKIPLERISDGKASELDSTVTK